MVISMFEKSRLKKKIKMCKREIQDLEQRRTRSQAALVEAILTNTTPDDQDVEYFNNFTHQINTIRNRMQEYQSKLDKL